MRRRSAVTPAASRPEILDVRDAAGGDQDPVGPDGVLLAARVLVEQVEAVFLALDPRRPRAERELDAALLERALERLDGVGVLLADQVRQHLDDRDLRAEVGEDRGELAADHAAAEHDQALGHVIDLEQLGRDQAVRVVEAGDRRLGRTRAGRDDRALEAHLLTTLDLQRVRAREAPATLHDLDADALHEAAETLHDAVHDALAVGLHLLEVERDAIDLDAERREPLARLVEAVRRLHEGLRRDAADVQAGAPHGAFLDAHDRGAELHRPDRRRIAAGACAEHREIAFDSHIR